MKDSKRGSCATSSCSKCTEQLRNSRRPSAMDSLPKRDGPRSPQLRTSSKDRRNAGRVSSVDSSIFRLARLRSCLTRCAWSETSSTYRQKDTLKSPNYASKQARQLGDCIDRWEAATDTKSKERRWGGGGVRPPVRPTACPPVFYRPLVTTIPLASATGPPPCTESSGLPGSVW